jgi:hypothetical protein
MAKRTVRKAKLRKSAPSGAELVDALQKAGIVSSDTTLRQLLDATKRISGPEIAWTAVADSDKYCFILK